MAKKIKIAYSCATVPNQPNWDTQLPDTYSPKIGDVGLFRVLDCDGKYMKTPKCSSNYLFTNDLIMAAYGARYATNQYEAYLPQLPTRAVELVGRGGVVAQVASQNQTHLGQAIPLELIAFATDANGLVINTIQTLKPFRADTQRAKIILSVGSAMDSGKTTTAANICAGISRAGHTSAYIKLTGTAYPKDTTYCEDRGADYVTDFSQRGFPSTFQIGIPTLLSLYQELIDDCFRQVAPNYILVEIADGILQQETRQLLQNKAFMDTVSGVVLSCGDSLGVISGIQLLNYWGIKPLLISGLFTASQLLIEEVKPIIDSPVFNIQELFNSEMMPILEQSPLAGHATVSPPLQTDGSSQQAAPNQINVLRA